LRANSHSSGQEIPIFLWKAKCYDCVHKNPSLDPILSQMNPVHTLPHHLSGIHSNIIFTSTTMSCKWSLPFRFSNQNILCISHSSHPYYTLHSSRSSIWSTE